jgi:hypothetical protein
MNLAYLNTPDFSFFCDARKQLHHMVEYLQSDERFDNEHGDIEQYIQSEGFEVLRSLFQGYLDLRAANEATMSNVHTDEGIHLNHIKHCTKRKLTTLFGDVTVKRKSYSQRLHNSIFPLDAQLNLPAAQYSDGIRQRVAIEARKSSYDEAVESISQTTGGYIPKRQSLKLAQDVAQDFDDFYLQNRYLTREKTDNLLVLTFDGKGIVMRPEGLRECTKKAALKSKKLNSRWSAGEKKDRKRMAQVAAVYTALPHIRTPEAIMKSETQASNVHNLNVAERNKRVWASIENTAEEVIEAGFLEALQRDPSQQRQWVVLIDGHPHQIRLINRVMKKHQVKASIIMDFIHVLEYVWKAAWCFYEKGDDNVEEWVAKHALKILHGHSNQVAKGMRISATKLGLTQRENINKCADYLLKNKARLQYGEALTSGYPIASGVIEGACRHLINDRLDITGARWSLQGAEAILKLRSLKSSGDFNDYWDFHKRQSNQRNYG